MKKVFFDSDVILDFLLGREPYATHMEYLLENIEKGKFKAYTTSVVYSNVYYILNDIKKRKDARLPLRDLRNFIDIQVIDQKALDQALESEFKDFEDALQYFSSLRNNIDFITTRNKKDYKYSSISVVTPEELVNVFLEP